MNVNKDTDRPLSLEETAGYEQTLCPGEDLRDCGPNTTNATFDAVSWLRSQCVNKEYRKHNPMVLPCCNFCRAADEIERLRFEIQQYEAIIAPETVQWVKTRKRSAT